MNATCVLEKARSFITKHLILKTETMIKLQTRVSKHRDNIYHFLWKIDSECRELRLSMNDSNVMEKFRNIRFLTDLQKKYRRILKLLNY